MKNGGCKCDIENMEKLIWRELTELNRKFCNFVHRIILYFKVDQSGEIICFEKGGCPWKEHLFELEKEHQVKPNIKYALYEDQSKKWRVQVIFSITFIIKFY